MGNETKREKITSNKKKQKNIYQASKRQGGGFSKIETLKDNNIIQ